MSSYNPVCPECRRWAVNINVPSGGVRLGPAEFECRNEECPASPYYPRAATVSELSGMAKDISGNNEHWSMRRCVSAAFGDEVSRIYDLGLSAKVEADLIATVTANKATLVNTIDRESETVRAAEQAWADIEAEAIDILSNAGVL